MKFRHLILLALALSCGIAWAADNPNDEKAPVLKPIVPGEKASGPQVTAFAPLAYFNENCARCHGEYGSFYGDKFAKNLDDAGLHAIVGEMADGPAGAPLAPAQLDAVTAWHRAFRDGKPFVAIVKAEKTEGGWQLIGEISPGATLQINGEKIGVDGSNWKATVDSDAAKLRACLGDEVTELDAGAAAWGP